MMNRRTLTCALIAAAVSSAALSSAPLSTAERDTLRELLQRIAAGAGLIPGVHPGLARGATNC